MMLTDSPAFAVGMMLAGLAAGMGWYTFRLKKENLPASAAVWAAVLGSVLALLCAKAGFLLHDLGANLFDGYYDEVTDLSAETLSFVCGAAGIVAGTALGAKIAGIRPAKALDLFAAPGCVFLCLARLAEGGMDILGVGDAIEAEWLQFFPLAMRNGWGDAYLSVFVLEAVTALVCLVPALRKGKEGDWDGRTFSRTAVCLLGAQVGWEMLLQYPYVRTFYTSFVSLEQVFCAVFLLVLLGLGCRRTGKWWTVAAAACLMGVSAFFQFFRDNKIEVEWEWALDNAWTIALVAFVLVSAALVPIGLEAYRTRKK